MTEPASVQELFRGRHFDQEIIVLCVRWYLTFKLSSRDLVQMMAERGIALAHTTILGWVQRYVPDFEKRWNQYARAVGDSWRVQPQTADQKSSDRSSALGGGSGGIEPRKSFCQTNIHLSGIAPEPIGRGYRERAQRRLWLRESFP
jgi:hypothetical protein